MKAIRQRFERATLWNGDFSLAKRAFDYIVIGAGSSEVVKTLKTKNMQARKLFWFCVQVHTHRASYLLL